MIRLVVNGADVDLPRGLKITIRRDNPAYLGKDVNAIKGGFSYPFDLVLSARNRKILRQPGRIDAASAPARDLPAQLYAGPDLFMTGRLTVLRSTSVLAKVAFVNNPLSDLTKVKMNEVEIGRYSFSSLSRLLSAMEDSTRNPTTRPWLAFPVYNGALNPDPEDATPNDNQFQNAYDFGTGQFRPDFPLSLFLRAEYVLRQIMETQGYVWTDLFHLTDEHRRITLVNNRALNKDAGPVALSAPYRNMLPATTVSAFLKDYCRLFCLAPFARLNGDQITLQPLQNLVYAPPADDWTNYASHTYERQANASIGRFAFPSVTNIDTQRFNKWNDLGKPDVVRDDFPQVPPEALLVADTLYYIASRNTYAEYYEQEDGSLLGDFNSSFGSVVNPLGVEEVVTNLSPIQQEQLLFYPDVSDNLLVPTWSTSLAAPPVFGQEADSAKVAHRLAIYRGLQQTSQLRPYPFGGLNNYQVDFSPIPGESLALRWLGNQGLYANHWADWDGMLQGSHAVTRNFLLPLIKLISFDFRNKLRVENQNYFVRSLEFELSDNAEVRTKCTLVSVS